MVHFPNMSSFNWSSLVGKNQEPVKIEKGANGVEELKGIKIQPLPNAGRSARGLVAVQLNNNDIVMVKARDLAKRIGVKTAVVQQAARTTLLPH